MIKSEFTIMKSKLLTIGVLALVFALIWIGYLPEKNTIQISEELKNLPEFVENSFGGRVLEFNLSAVTEPGDNYNSKIVGLQVKLLKNDHSNEVNWIELNEEDAKF